MASIQIFQKIVDDNIQQFQKYQLDEKDILFIKVTSPGITLVSKTIVVRRSSTAPLDGASVSPDKPWPYKGRDPSQAFLFEIVANKRCSIDVDKVWY